MEKIKPVPAFYGVYLLRSTIRHSGLYIGSTPNPTRRLAQHNGKSKGGAVRTSRLSLQPWEMVCIVAGFPSNIAALQFEWAWHNSHLTRHISSIDRLTLPTVKIRTNKRTGGTRKKLGRPRTGITEKLSNLHLLLRSKYFSAWPLEVKFFTQDVFRMWNGWVSRASESIRPEINVTLDMPESIAEEVDTEPPSAQKSTKRKAVDLIGRGGIEGIDPTYARFKAILHKLKDHIGANSGVDCAICRNSIDTSQQLFNICLHEKCTCTTHLHCLSESFLAHSPAEHILPKQGNCPVCQTTTDWSELMRVLSIRNRGEKEVKKLLKQRKTATAAVAADILDDEGSSSESDAGDSEAESEVIMDVDELQVDSGIDDDDGDMASMISVGSKMTATNSPMILPDKGGASEAGRREIVIADSEDER